MDQENYDHPGDMPDGQNIPPNNTPPRMQEPPFQKDGNPGGFGGGHSCENGFSTAALVLGIISLAMSCIPYLAIPLGALGILFALLSKGGSSMSPRGKTGLGISVAGITLGIIMIIVVLFTNTITQGRTFEEFYQDYMDYYNGSNDSPDEAPNDQGQDQQDLEEYFRKYFNNGNGGGNSGGGNMPKIKENPDKGTIPVPDDLI